MNENNKDDNRHAHALQLEIEENDNQYVRNEVQQKGVSAKRLNKVSLQSESASVTVDVDDVVDDEPKGGAYFKNSMDVLPAMDAVEDDILQEIETDMGGGE